MVLKRQTGAIGRSGVGPKLKLARALGFLAAIEAEQGDIGAAERTAHEMDGVVTELEGGDSDGVEVALVKEHLRLERHRIAIRSGRASGGRKEVLRNLERLETGGGNPEIIHRLRREARHLTDEPSGPEAAHRVVI